MGEGLVMGDDRLVMVNDSTIKLHSLGTIGVGNNSLLGGWVNLNANLSSQSSLGENFTFSYVILFCEEDDPEYSILNELTLSMPRRYQVLHQGSEHWGSASAHARTALRQARVKSVTSVTQLCYNTSMAPAEMALPCWRIRIGSGCEGSRRGDTAPSRLPKRIKRYRQCVVLQTIPPFPCWSPTAWLSILCQSWKDSDARATITHCAWGHCPGCAFPGRDWL